MVSNLKGKTTVNTTNVVYFIAGVIVGVLLMAWLS